MFKEALIVGLGALSLTGCVKYRPRALDPPSLETQYRARSLTAPALVEYLHQNGQAHGAWPPRSLDLRALALISYFYSPDLAVARAKLAAAEAAVAVAGLRPSSSVAVEGGYNPNPESNVLYGIFPSFTIETAGKRGLRILQAQRVTESARAGLVESGWLVRSRVRTSLFNYLVAERRKELLETEVAVRNEIAGIFDKRVSVGEAPRPELDIYRVALLNTRSSLDAAAGETAQARMTLAGWDESLAKEAAPATLSPALDSARPNSMNLFRQQRFRYTLFRKRVCCTEPIFAARSPTMGRPTRSSGSRSRNSIPTFS